MSNEIILQVADEIEKDVNYDGLYYWNNETNTGCAMTRLFQKFGGEVVINPQKGISLFQLNGFNSDLRFSGVSLLLALEHVTKIKEDFWENTFLDFSIVANGAMMAKALRYIASESFDPYAFNKILAEKG